MFRFLMRVLINAVALWAAVALLTPHIQMQNNSIVALLVLAVIFGLVNAILRPIVNVAACPVIILTLGLGTLLVNWLMFVITGWLGRQFGIGFTIDNWLYGFLGALIVSVLSFILSRFLIAPVRKPMPTH